MLPDQLGQVAGVDAVQAGDALLLQESVQSALAAEVGRLLAKVTDDIGGYMGSAAFKILRDHAVVADQREGLHHHLPVVAWVGERLQIAGHGGGEYHLGTQLVHRSAKAFALENFPVFQQQVNFSCHVFASSIHKFYE